MPETDEKLPPELVETDSGLAFFEPGDQGTSHMLRFDFDTPALRRRLQGGWRSEGLLRACGLGPGKRPHVADLTAGQGTDALLLAAHGCEVHLSEQNPWIHALLSDALVRAASVEWLQAAVDRMTLLPRGSSETHLPALSKWADVACVDPMFDTPRRAANRIEMRMFAALIARMDEPPGENSDRLLVAAAVPQFPRTVVKRHRRAPPLQPDRHHTHDGRVIRFDVYLHPAPSREAG